MNKAMWIPMIAIGCIEYEPGSTLPPAGVANPRPLSSTTQTDKVVQVTEPEVDILWVVDNSCSMAEEQAGISQNGPVFLDFFLGSGLDYHVGVVSTDMDDPSQSGKLRQSGSNRWIEDGTVNPSQLFGQMIELGTGGSGTERGRDAAYGALEVHHDGYNAGFERDNAALHVVVLSDESDFSSNVPISEFVTYLQTKKWNSDMVTFSSIVTPPTVCAGASTPGDAYIAITNQVGGIYWNICDREWSEVLELLGIQASGLKREYFLSQLPVPDTIEVWVVEGPVTFAFDEGVDWVYSQQRNSIVFNEYVPSPLAEVYVRYEVLSAGEQDQ